MDHDEVRFGIPAWATGRLDPQARRALEAHLAECPTCDAVATTARTLASAIERDGEALFAGHPEVDALLRYAEGTPSPRDPELARHVASCASCSLELRAWQARRSSRNPVRAEAKHWRGARVAAAGLAAGFLLGLLTMQAIRERPERVHALPFVPRVLLQNAVRGLDREPELILRPASVYAFVDVTFELPAIAPTAIVRFEIQDAEGKSTWTATAPASNVAADLARDELVGFLVPAEALADGEHRLLVSVERSTAPALLSARFGVRR